MELCSDFDALFFLNHSVMMNSQDGGLVGLGRVGVQNEVATCKPFFTRACHSTFRTALSSAGMMEYQG